MSETDSKETRDKNLAAEAPQHSNASVAAKEQGRRKKETRKRKAAELVIDLETGISYDAGERTTSTASGFRSVAAKRTRLQEQPACMKEMPIDILAEIAHHLSPADLLQLARSTNWFRQMLMSKQAASIWQAAESAVGLPKCPSHMSSPQLARLLFGASCMGCLKKRAQTMLIEYGIRLCKTCRQEKIRKGVDISHEHWAEFGQDLNDEVFTLIPSAPTSATKRHQAYTNLVCDEADDEEEDEDEPEDESKELFLERTKKSRRISMHDLRYESYYTPYLYEALKEYIDLRDSRAEQMAFVKRKVLAVKRIVASSKTIEDWVLEQQESKKAKNLDKKNECEDLVVRKLKASGYTSDDFTGVFADTKWTKLVKKDRPLTDRVWTNLKPKLEEIIQARREQRNIYEKETRIEEKTRSLQELIRKSIGKEMYVDITKALESPWIKELILRDDANYKLTRDDLNSVEEDMKAQNIKEKKRVLKETAKKLIQARYDYNLNMVPENLEDSSAEDIALDCLFHPTAVTYICSNLISYSEAFSRMWRANSGFEVHLYVPGPIEPASKEIMRIADKIHRSVIPDVKSMSDLKGNFICMRCPPPVRRMQTWEKLISHFADENETYRKRKKLQNASEDVNIRKTVNKNIHDIKSIQTLAILTGAEFHDEVKEVKLCGCWDADLRMFVPSKGQSYTKNKWCETCERLSSTVQVLQCTEEHEAHDLACHTEVNKSNPTEQLEDLLGNMTLSEQLKGEITDDEEPVFE